MRSRLPCTCVALMALLLTSCAPDPASHCVPGSGRPRVVLLGVDGASWRVMGPLIDQGELPHFATLLREGARMESFGTLETTASPVVWTSVATGRRAEDHGIRDFAQKLPGGGVIPISSSARTARAIWEVATEHGVSVGVLNWWASWPAEEVAGYVVSDHANPALVEFLSQDERYFTADPEKLEGMNQDFFPPDLGSTLQPLWIDPEDFPYDELARRGGFSPEQMGVLRKTPLNARTRYSILKSFFAADAPILSAGIRLQCERPTDLQMIYVRGPDPLQHYAWDLVEPEKYARPPRNHERDRGLVEGVYRYVDSLLGELLAVLGDDVWLIVASDHGAEPVANARDPRRRGRPGGHTTAAKGVLFLRGPHVRAGLQLTGADPLDLMPTAAWLLGLPLSKELEGEPLTGAFEEEFANAHPMDFVDSYGPREAQPGARSNADEAMLEGLRALGYIE